MWITIVCKFILAILTGNSAKRQKIDGALLDMITIDLQPPSIVENNGFKDFVKTLDSRYTLPSRRTITRSLLPQRYDSAKEKLSQELREASTCSLTTDYWTSCSSQSYLTVTCHFIDRSWELRSCCLYTYQSSVPHTAENIAFELKRIAEEWHILNKISCVITDNAANMIAAVRLTGWKSLPCFAHTLNLVVQESLQKDDELSLLQRKCRRIVTYFKQSTNARSKLTDVQLQIGGGEVKLVQDVATRWNSSFFMFKRLIEQYQAVNTALCLMDQNDMCLSSSDVGILADGVTLLEPFEEATREVSAEKYVCISKIIPLARSLQHITSQSLSTRPLKLELVASMMRRFTNIEANYILAASTLLDPRFKKLGFADASGNNAVERLAGEVASIIACQNVPSNDTNHVEVQSGQSELKSSGLWAVMDERIAQKQTQPSTSSSLIVLRTYFDQANISRQESPLKWWMDHESTFSSLSSLVKKYLAIPATSVPAERLFSKAGELISLRRNRLKPSNVNMMLFLNKV